MSSVEATLLEFPCQFPIKAMGKISADFEKIVVDIIQSHVLNMDKCFIKSRPSKKSNYLAVTVTIEATSKSQLDAIYQDLTKHPLVLITL